MKAIRPFLVLCSLSLSCAAIDGDNNQLSDVWEVVYAAKNLPPTVDSDGDGFTNAQESAAGTDPRDGASFPMLHMMPGESGTVAVAWPGLAGKRYTLEMKADLRDAAWTPLGTPLTGQGTTAQMQLAIQGGGAGFFRLRAGDQDSDLDGYNDWEELAIGFDPLSPRSRRSPQLDSAAIPGGLNGANTISVSVYDDTCSERWPDAGVLVVRRSGGVQPLTVNVAFGGTAVRTTDYATSTAGNVVSFAPGVREVFVEIHPVADALAAEPTETVTLTAIAGTGYALGSQVSATVSIQNETAASAPSAKAAARFLVQASFGPHQDSADADLLPDNVAEVMNLGFSGWIDDQLARPVGYLRPYVQWARAQPSSAEIYNDIKQNAWWGRVMGLPKLRPDSVTNQAADPLRQRVAFALSQIYIISDRMEELGVNPEGMVHFYDLLEKHAFGNFRDLLYDVSVHPCMGIYLSHLGNRKANTLTNTFPDENYAREVMQLFSIGLWMLNPDGSRILDSQNRPIPTYNNSDITQFARIFTGLSFGNNVNFAMDPRDYTVPMKGWDAEHDLGPKTLLLGAATPQRTASAGNTGTATFADVNAAIDCLFNHPNVGPFIGRQLIQRLVTSNPSPAYIQRVSLAFNQAPRGDLGRTVKAILLDPEARDPAMMSDPTFGKLRAPMLKCVNLAHAFDAKSTQGWYYLDAFILDYVEEPMKSPSVFNFYLPTYTPPGIMAQNGLVAPEFGIINASSGVTAPNYFWNVIVNGMHRWGVGRAEQATCLNIDEEMKLNVPASEINNPGSTMPALDPDALIRRLDFVLTGGTLAPRNFQIIREALQRIGPGSGHDWPRSRLKVAIYLILCSPEFAVQH